MSEIREQFDPLPAKETPLIGLIGYARSGKDTVGKILTDDYGYERRSFADGVRRVALAIDPFIDNYNPPRLSTAVSLYGWEEVKDGYPEVRRLLQVIGTEAVRDIIGPNTWVDLAMRDLPRRCVFTDVRYPNEAEAIKAAGGVIWRVVRPGYGPVNGHPSESALDHWPEDRTIPNAGDLEALRRRVLR